MNLLGTDRIRTTAFHPQSNGMVERFHRQLKAAIKAHETFKWTSVLPLILLSIGCAYKEDLQGSSTDTSFNFSYDSNYLTDFKAAMAILKPIPVRSREYQNTFVHPDLISCSHVFLRVDTVRSPLQQPYTGPHKVTMRKNKTYIIESNGKLITVSIDRL
ncbi:hypothetical protein B4U80_06604 [Leptotrombidium deliense]|uniref:Integrase catalytic domain-containing protein n=1 Tax=Leptotrombidium deliense TaxID=299467 RepID=A0A443QRS9_9ACAR|nr:hypothetical protein B4U80_06604 [Leptotrombidium deliense]